uniref:Uncharacterized protein n=1 Tax=Arundo donax TaxID=35708 RepID=A0A0A9BXY5_ARUDO
MRLYLKILWAEANITFIACLDGTTWLAKVTAFFSQ